MLQDELNIILELDKARKNISNQLNKCKDDSKLFLEARLAKANRQYLDAVVNCVGKRI